MTKKLEHYLQVEYKKYRKWFDERTGDTSSWDAWTQCAVLNKLTEERFLSTKDLRKNAPEGSHFYFDDEDGDFIHQII